MILITQAQATQGVRMTDQKINGESSEKDGLHPASDDIRPAPDAQKQVEKHVIKTGVSLATCVIVSLACSAFAGLVSFQLATTQHVTVAPLVLVNGSALAEAQMSATTSKPDMSPEQAKADGLAFVEGLQKALKPYTDAGIAVVNSSVVMNRPDGLDITKQIAQQLGLEVD